MPTVEVATESVPVTNVGNAAITILLAAVIGQEPSVCEGLTGTGAMGESTAISATAADAIATHERVWEP